MTVARLPRVIAGALALFAVSTFAPHPAGAHFFLKSPAAWRDQDSLGNPQKLGPCGDDGAAAMTNMVTAYQPGDKVIIQLDEEIFHPGHYRVALSVDDRSQLPPEPKVTPGANTPCGTADVMNPPVFPVLADGVLDHTQAFNGTQQIEITLPNNITCSKCTIQVLEFMSQHPLNNPGGCFYHHCADISIGMGAGGAGGGAATTTGSGATVASSTSTGATTGTTTGAGTGAGGEEATGSFPSNPDGSTTSGCGCSTPAGAPSAFGLLTLVALAALGRKKQKIA